MNCQACGQPERVTDLGGVKYSNISPNLGVCNNCINRELDEVTREEERARRNVRTPRTKAELKAYHAELEATIEREVVEHNGTINELRRDVAALIRRCLDLDLDVPEFDDWTMKNWGTPNEPHEAMA
jgi:hypothetical protein